MDIKLGQRIKFFRNRLNITQSDLEISAELSTGTISRIENDQINPDKETIIKIAKVLELNNKELDYLIGITRIPASNEEIEKAKLEAGETLDKNNRVAYLLDDRWRFYMYSKAFVKLLKLSPEELNYVTGKTTAFLVVDPDSPMMKRVDEKHQKELISMYLPQYYTEMSYMEDDSIYQDTVKAIMKHSFARNIWNDLQKQKIRRYIPEEELVIHFDIYGIKFPLYYYGHALPKNHRFIVVEYHTKNKILKLMQSLI